MIGQTCDTISPLSSVEKEGHLICWTFNGRPAS